MTGATYITAISKNTSAERFMREGSNTQLQWYGRLKEGHFPARTYWVHTSHFSLLCKLLDWVVCKQLRYLYNRRKVLQECSAFDHILWLCWVNQSNSSKGRWTHWPRCPALITLCVGVWEARGLTPWKCLLRQAKGMLEFHVILSCTVEKPYSCWEEIS